MSIQQVLIDGQWVDSSATETFQACNPATGKELPDSYPVSPWEEVETAIHASADVSREVRGWPGGRFADFLERYAERIEARAEDLVATAQLETALPAQPRLKDVELPRTTNQLRQAAAAAREGSWAMPVIDTKTNIRSVYRPLGPVVVFGPNNFPFAFNGISGGDFAAAVAAGNPVVAKGHSTHPGTTRGFAEEARQAARETDMPPAFVQLIYRTSHENGARLVAHPLVGATAYTGSRRAGLVLKEAADKAAKPIYLELSSINPVFVLPGALEERLDQVADEFVTSCLMGTGQFCTNPGLVILLAGAKTDAFVDSVAGRFGAAPVGTLLGEGVLKNMEASINRLLASGARTVAGGRPGGGTGYSYCNTLLKVDGDTFLGNSDALQAETFGNSSLLVVAKDADQLFDVAERLEGNLTGTIYSHTAGSNDALYDRVEPILSERVGRLLNDKMPTGVAVTPAMNHGGPFPATGHPGFTAVGIPSSIRRFAMLSCYDNVRPSRLPPALGDQNPNSQMWRYVDSAWTQGHVDLE